MEGNGSNQAELMFLFGIGVIGFFMLISIVFIVNRVTDWLASVRNDRDNLKWYQSWYKVKNGCSSKYGQYFLVSIDGGQTWYDAEQLKTGFKLNGLAEEKRPGLLKHLEAFDALCRHVKANGPIDLAGKHAAVGIGFLQDAGFCVECKPNKESDSPDK